MRIILVSVFPEWTPTASIRLFARIEGSGTAYLTDYLGHAGSLMPGGPKAWRPIIPVWEEADTMPEAIARNAAVGYDLLYRVGGKGHQSRLYLRRRAAVIPETALMRRWSPATRPQPSRVTVALPPDLWAPLDTLLQEAQAASAAYVARSALIARLLASHPAVMALQARQESTPLTSDMTEV